MAATLRVDRPNGTTLGWLPDHAGLSVQIEHNNVGAISFQYLHNGEKAAVLDNDDGLIYVIDNGIERNDVYLLEDDGDDPTDAAGEARPISVTGRGVMAALERAIVYPREHRPGQGVVGLDPFFAFVEPARDDNQHEPAYVPTPGRIMNVLINRARARASGGEAFGGIPITTDFDQERDSAGNLWPEDYTVQYDAGITLLAVLQGMMEQGWCDARMNGLTLQMYAPDTTLNRDLPDVILRRGREVMSGPRARSRRTIRSVMLAVGDEGAAAVARDDTAVARYGRREGFLGQGGMTALDTLTRVTDKTLKTLTRHSEGFTVEVDLKAEGPVPFRDFRVGDRIRYDQRRLNEREYEPMRVRTLSTTWDGTGNKAMSLELNDLFVERMVRLARKIEGIVNGSSNNTRPPRPPDPDVGETIAPRAPASVSVDSGTVTRRSGEVEAVATVSFPKVVYNVDGSVFDDFGQYVVQISYPERRDNGWGGTVSVHDNENDPLFTYVENLPPGARVRFRARAIDLNGNKSTWTESNTHILATDADPPATPDAPSVQVLIGGVRVGWDGMGRFGEPMPVDFARCIVHMSTDGVGFPVSDATRAATLLTRGYVTIAPLDTSRNYYFRLQTEDRHGNLSAPSATAQAQPRQVVSDDLAARIIRLGALADIERASVTTTFLSTFESDDDRWVLRTGTGVLSTVNTPTAAVGGSVGQFSTSASGTWEFADNVPYDPEQLYRVQARVRTSVANVGNISLGVAGYAADRVTRVSAANTTTGPDHMVAAYQRQVSPGNQWVTVTGFMRGRAVGASLPGAQPNPGTPRELAATARYVRPVVTVTGATTWEIDQFTVELLEIPPNVIGTVQIADATIVNAKIADAAIDDAKIGTLTVTTLKTGVMQADMLLTGAGGIRTSATNSGQRVLFNSLGLRGFDNTGTTFNLSSTGTLEARGELQAGPDNGAHVSMKVANETVNGVPLDVADRVASIRLYSGANTFEHQPAIIRNDFMPLTENGIAVPVLTVRSGQRTNATGSVAYGRAVLRMVGATATNSSNVTLAADSVSIISGASDSPTGLFIRSSQPTGLVDAPLTIGIAGQQRLLLSRDQVNAVGADNNPNAELRLNDVGGAVQIANLLIVRGSPAFPARAQLVPRNSDHLVSMVFAPGGVHFRNRLDTAYQPIFCTDVVQSNPGSVGLADDGGRMGAVRRSSVDKADASQVIADVNVVDYNPRGNRDLTRAVETTNLPPILQDGDGARIGALLATLIASHQAVLDRLAALETPETP